METGQIIQWSNNEFKWELQDFSILFQEAVTKDKYPSFISPIFNTFNEGVEYEWMIKIYVFPNSSGEKEEFVSGYLVSNNDKSCTVRFSLIVDQKGKIRDYNLYSMKFDPDSSWGFRKLINQKLLFDKDNNMLLNDTLMVFCRIIHDDTDFQLINDLESLISDNIVFGDVKFILNNEQKLDAHKDILASRSSVFAAMFKHNMKEKESNEVRIEDIDYEVMKEVLRFIYSGRVKNLEKVSKELLKAAEKYALKGLKNICEKNLCETLEVDNAIECLALASVFNADMLKESVIDFIASHAKEIVDKPQLMNELANIPKNNFPDVVRSLVLQYTRNFVSIRII